MNIKILIALCFVQLVRGDLDPIKDQEEEILAEPAVVEQPAPELAEQLETAPIPPLQVLAEEATAVVEDKIDSLATGNLLFPGPLDANTAAGATGLTAAANAAGGILEASGQLAKDALNLNSKLVAPLILFGSKITAPVVKLKSKLASPLVFVGAKLTKPLAKGAVKLAAPALKVGQVAGSKIAPVTQPVVDGIADALNPLAVATNPLKIAVLPIGVAAGLGFQGLNIQEEIDSIDIEGDIDQLTNGAGILVDEIIQLQTAGVQAAGEAAEGVISGVANLLNKGKDRKKRMVPEDYQGEGFLQSFGDVEVISFDQDNEIIGEIEQGEIEQEIHPSGVYA